MAVYFATWDFNRPSDFSSGLDMRARCGRGEAIDYPWSTGVRTKMMENSTLIMVRQGQAPRGMIGIGQSVGTPYSRARHDDPSREGHYVMATWKFMFVDAVVAENEFPENYRGMRGGGWEVPSDLADHLIELFHRRQALTEIEIEQQIAHSTDLSETERTAIIRARRGQGRFRANVEAVEKGCRVTAIRDPALLTASHIKPWAACSNNEERLDGANGLLLAPHVDHLFDRGFISFTSDGDVLLSSAIDEADFGRLGVGPDTNVGRFSDRQQGYLDYHRCKVFQR